MTITINNAINWRLGDLGGIGERLAGRDWRVEREEEVILVYFNSKHIALKLNFF